MSIRFVSTRWCWIKEVPHCSHGKLNGIPVALVARFGVISKSTDSIDIVIKDLDLEPKIDAIMRDFLESSSRSFIVLPGGKN
ncbi:hypothetical protein Tco_0555676 [Tanacetum coccineum]